ncbi:MAG TPA: PepSY-like domain-containing protein [Sphingobacterium sp.]|nr:PepSY-like domain-containing protein [Sphingobacterium sp.]
MKTIMNSIVVMIMVMITTTALAQEKLITFNQLPKAAQNFVTKYYDQKNVSYVKLENEFLSSKEYEVRLHDGKKIDFDAKGNWKEVDCNKDAVPAEIVPGAIVTHVNKSFPNNTIVQISRSSKKYEVELSNGLDLEFDNKGKFLRIDD